MNVFPWWPWWLIGNAVPPGPAPPPPREAPVPVIYTVAGFMADMWAPQPPAELARAVEDLAYWQPVGYNNTAFPLGTGAADGVRELRRLILEEHPNQKFVLAGYSLGAIVVADVFDALRDGDMRHRWNDFLGAVSWGDPRREAHHQVGPDPGGEGIAGPAANLHNTPPNYRSWVNPKDIYANNPLGEPGEPYTLIFNLVMLKWDGSLLSILDEATDLIRRPIPEVIDIVNSVVGAIVFYTNQSPHTTYTADEAIPFVRQLLTPPPVPAPGPPNDGGIVVTPTPTPTPSPSIAKTVVGLIGSLLTVLVPYLLDVSAGWPQPYPGIIAGVLSLLTALGIYHAPYHTTVKSVEPPR